MPKSMQQKQHAAAILAQPSRLAQRAWRGQMACLALALALLPLAAWGQTGPWLHVTFTMGMHAVPLGAAAWLAALAVAAAAVRRARKGRWPSAGLGGLMLMALLAGAAWLAASACGA